MSHSEIMCADGTKVAADGKGYYWYVKIISTLPKVIQNWDSPKSIVSIQPERK